MPPVGLTFSPLNAPQPGQPGGQASPLQDAIKLLSFQLPTVVGAGAGSGVLGPMTGAGGLGSLQGNGSMNQFLMQLLRGIIPGLGQPGEQTPGAPSMPPPGGPPRPAVQFPQGQTPMPAPPAMPIPGGPETRY